MSCLEQPLGQVKMGWFVTDLVVHISYHKDYITDKETDESWDISII